MTKRCKPKNIPPCIKLATKKICSDFLWPDFPDKPQKLLCDVILYNRDGRKRIFYGVLLDAFQLSLPRDLKYLM